MNSVRNSATGIDSHIPLVPSASGRSSAERTIKTKVRKKEIKAEVFPSDSAVKMPEATIFVPQNR